MSIINLFIIAIALSMDTFSLTLSLSLISDKINQQTLFIVLVGFFHFLYPIIGKFIGATIINYLIINANKLLGLIFLILFLKLFYDLKHQKSSINNINIIYIIILSIIVSIDSFIVGIGLSSLVKNIITPAIIFALTSSLFTFLGFYLGTKANKNLGTKANYLGLILLLILSIVHLCK